ncbi:hypothetical protein DFA_02851 [Cavenderia fasciculata]|uniref:EGF-like domain-containing protein n=1 Tax=Cavenderia fasciculata TaxID=261658 RepID=F4PIM8_CACFS|nr:uncharacterized protein DFA_02851 [Cavenderia fasciculata]EGG24608.1 hypothetical protein DFA_02851 [Cavenderia fasciculata]|eukprot:XP_004362459.1 hypothetical protein DFA_02851 [Cavenderia fasciculata]
MTNNHNHHKVITIAVVFVILSLFVIESNCALPQLKVDKVVAGIDSAYITYNLIDCIDQGSIVPLAFLDHVMMNCTPMATPDTLRCTGLPPSNTSQYQLKINCTVGEETMEKVHWFPISTFGIFQTPVANVSQFQGDASTANATWSIIGGNPILTTYDLYIDDKVYLSNTNISHLLINHTMTSYNGVHNFTFIANCDGYKSEKQNLTTGAATFYIYQDITINVTVYDIGSRSASFKLVNISGADNGTVFHYYLNNGTRLCEGLRSNESCIVSNQFEPNTLNQVYAVGTIADIHQKSNPSSRLNFTTTPNNVNITTLSAYQHDNSQFTVEYDSVSNQINNQPNYTIFVNDTLICKDETNLKLCNVSLTDQTLISQHTIRLVVRSLPDSIAQLTIPSFNTWKAPVIENITATVNQNGQLKLDWNSLYGNPNVSTTFNVSLVTADNNSTTINNNDICQDIQNQTCTINNVTDTIHTVRVIPINSNFTTSTTIFESSLNFTLCSTTQNTTNTTTTITTTGLLCFGHGTCGNGTLGCTCDQGYEGSVCDQKITDPPTNKPIVQEPQLGLAFNLITSSTSYTLFVMIGLTLSQSTYINVRDIGSHSALFELVDLPILNGDGTQTNTVISYYLNQVKIQSNFISPGAQSSFNATKCFVEGLSSNTLYTIKANGSRQQDPNQSTTIFTTVDTNFTTFTDVNFTSIMAFQLNDSTFAVEYTSNGGNSNSIPRYTVLVNDTVYCKDNPTQYRIIPFLTNSQSIYTLDSQLHNIKLIVVSKPDSKINKLFNIKLLKNLTAIVGIDRKLTVEWDLLGMDNHGTNNTTPSPLISWDVSISSYEQSFMSICQGIEQRTCTTTFDLTGNTHRFNITPNVSLTYPALSLITNQINLSMCRTNQSINNGTFCSGNGICKVDYIDQQPMFCLNCGRCQCNHCYEGLLCNITALVSSSPLSINPSSSLLLFIKQIIK